MKPKATIFDCASNSSVIEHDMRDNCWNCAPFWRYVPTCPEHKRKLTLKGWCRDCRKFYDISDREAVK